MLLPLAYEATFGPPSASIAEANTARKAGTLLCNTAVTTANLHGQRVAFTRRTTSQYADSEGAVSTPDTSTRIAQNRLTSGTGRTILSV